MNNQTVINSFRDALKDAGYDPRCIRSDYEFADFGAHQALVRGVPLAAFLDYPYTYRNACIGVIRSEAAHRGREWVQKHRALGAPLIFEVADQVVQPWSVGAEFIEPIGEPFAFNAVERAIAANRSVWNPQSLGRVKRPTEMKAGSQLDIFDLGLTPMLAEFFQDKLKDLLERAFKETAACFQSVQGEEPSMDYLIPYLFRFVTAKVFMDRADAEGWAGLNDPLEILKKAEDHSGSELLGKLPKGFLHEAVLEKAWSSISKTLQFQNLSVPDLVSLYERLFVDNKSRRESGIHSTPIELAHYIVEQLPWKDVPIHKRRVFEPFCGHGIFLALAMDRLHRDLMQSLGPEDRHQYFRRMLVGVEKDPLAIEVCRLILTYSDYPNGDSWDLYCADVFTWPKWDATLRSVSAVLANPPYVDFSPEARKAIGARKAQAPVEILDRLLRQPPPMIGMVLPYSFLTSPSYKDANRQLGQRYEEVSIVELPPIFRYADNNTIALTASGRRESGNHVTVRFAEVRATQAAVDQFLNDSKVSDLRSAVVEVSPAVKAFTLWLPPKGSIFESLPESFPKLAALAKVRRGIHWVRRNDGRSRLDPRTDVASDTPRNGFMKGAEKMQGNLFQFSIRKFRYLSILEEHQSPRDKAWKLPWDKSKVVCNAARLHRESPWRLAAWADEEGLAFTQAYLAIWPQDGVSEFALAAILCSPFANAFIAEREHDRNNHVSRVKALPLPPITYLEPDGVLHNHAKEVQSLLTPEDFTVGPSMANITEALLRLDAAVLDAYELPAHVQRHLLNQFQGSRRPVAVPFKGYSLDSFADAITLSDYFAITYDWDNLDERRCALIEKDIEHKSLTPEEITELERLEYLADLLIQLENPNPFAELDELIAKLKAEGQWRDSI